MAYTGAVGPDSINLLGPIGDFADGAGAVIGTPFVVGTGWITVMVSDAATRLHGGRGLGGRSAANVAPPARRRLGLMRARRPPR